MRFHLTEAEVEYFLLHCQVLESDPVDITLQEIERIYIYICIYIHIKHTHTHIESFLHFAFFFSFVLLATWYRCCICGGFSSDGYTEMKFYEKCSEIYSLTLMNIIYRQKTRVDGGLVPPDVAGEAATPYPCWPAGLSAALYSQVAPLLG